MDREKRLLKNTGILVLGNVSVRALSFLLVPLYTSILSTSDYGLYELIMTTVSLLIPILTLDIVDSALRFSMESKNDRDQVYSIALKYIFAGFAATVVLLMSNRIFKLVDFILGNELVFLLMFTELSLIEVLIAFAKGRDMLKETAIAGVIGAIATAILTIVLLIPLKKGINGYFIAFLTGYALQILYLLLKLRCCLGNDIRIKKNNLEKKMLHYSIPLIANNVAWWVNNALDRYVLTYYCGMAINGVYSVAYKIPTIINMVQSVFHQAWTLSAIQEYNSDESHLFFATIYRRYQLLLICVCSMLVLLNQTIARFMYAYEFYEAWKYVPMLCIGFVFLGLSNFMGGIFNALKKPNIIATTTVAGAALNGVLNMLLIPAYNAYGAAIATCISYVAVWCLRMVYIHKELRLNLISVKEIISYVILLGGSLYIFGNNLLFTVLEYAMIPLMILLYRNDLPEILYMVCKNMGVCK